MLPYTPSDIYTSDPLGLEDFFPSLHLLDFSSLVYNSNGLNKAAVLILKSHGRGGGGVLKSLLLLSNSQKKKPPRVARPPYYTPLTFAGGSEVSSLNVSTGQLSFLPPSSKPQRGPSNRGS